MPSPFRRYLLATVIAVAMLAAAGCGGSAISPEQFQAANRSLYNYGSSTQPGDSPGATVPGQTPGTGAQPGQVIDPAAPGGSQPGTKASGGTKSVPGSPNAPQATSCAGFKNQTGITDSTITIGNASDVSGPIPGLFKAAQLATQAYVQYFNATSSLCGRKLKLVTQDTRTDAGADQSAYLKLCDEAFAAVGSMATFDSGGAGSAAKCGLPDIRTASITSDRSACTTCFAVQSTGDHEAPNVWDYWVKTNRPATQKAAFLYLNAGAAAENAKTQISVGTKRGMKWVYTSPIDVADFNYGPYVQQMKSKGVQFVQFIGAYQQSVRLLQAMQSASFNPAVKFFDSSIYDPAFLQTGGGAATGAYMSISFTPLDSNQPELNLYRQWLQQVSPGSQPTFFGLFAWSAAKLFVEKAAGLGGKLTRASLVSTFRSTEGWTGGGMHAPMSVGGKHPPSCYRYMVVKNGAFVPYGPTKYVCNGYSRG